MDLIFANPTGFLMLLGIPAVLAIHLLQNRAPRIPVSTLFLLARLAEEEHRGSAIERLRNSAALWLQLLAILWLTLLIVRPMPLHSDSAQAVAIVLDNTNSMRAFTSDVRQTLESETRRLARRAAHTEWLLLTTDPARPSLYNGTNREELLAALDLWHPDSAEHEHGAALRHAADITGPGGLVILVTDHIPEARPPGVALLAVGKPLDNAGFGSLAIEQTPDGKQHWRATLINHSDTPQSRKILFLRNGIESDPEPMQLPPGHIRVLRGEIPPETDYITLSLFPADSLPVDDTLYILPTRQRILHSHNALTNETLRHWANRVMQAQAGMLHDAPPGNSHLIWMTPDTAPASITPHHRIVLGAGLETGDPIVGAITPESHPLVRDLSWLGLLCRVYPGKPLEPGDQPLLWMNEHPLVLLRTRSGGATDLHFRFDVDASNAARHPAVIILLHRFLESIRNTLPGEETRIVELHQRIEVPPASSSHERVLQHAVPGTPSGAITTLPVSAPVYAPANPGFFQIMQDGTTVFHGAAIFTETRQADLRKAATHNDLDQHTAEQTSIHRRADSLTPVWLALLGFTLLANWHTTSSKPTGTS
jgi:hypothetical protein